MTCLNCLPRRGRRVSLSLLLLTVFSPCQAAAGEVFLRGDSNADGVLNISDAQALLSFLFHGEALPACPDAADANDDGALDVSDVVTLLDFLFAPLWRHPRSCRGAASGCRPRALAREEVGRGP